MRMTRRFCVRMVGMLVATALSFLSGCAIGPSAAQRNDADISQWLASLPEPGADYGAYPDNYREIIEAAMTGMLKDPDSARYSGFTQPKHDQVVEVQYPHRGLILDTSVAPKKTAIYGYAVCAAVNAKNSFGGYTGDKLYWFLIRNGQVVRSAMAGEVLYIGHFANC